MSEHEGVLLVGMVGMIFVMLQALVGSALAEELGMSPWLGALLGQLTLPIALAFAYILGWIVIQVVSVYVRHAYEA